MQVQNKLQLVTALLPSMVQSTGLTVTKSSSDFLMVIGFVSTDGRMTEADLSDYVKSALNDPLKRVEGVGNTQLFGAAMPCASGSIRTSSSNIRSRRADVAAAIQAQNAQVSAGQLGGLPATQRAATQRHRYGAKPSADAGAVSQHHPQEYRRRLAGAHQ